MAFTRQTEVRPHRFTTLHWHCKGVGSIPAGGPIVDEFSAVLTLIFDIHVCMYDFHSILRHINPKEFTVH